MINHIRNRIAVSDMNKGTLKQVWFFMACLLVMTYLNASSKLSHNGNGMFMHDIHGVVYKCDKPNLVKEGLCREYGRVIRSADGVYLHTEKMVKHISYDQKPLISKKPVGHEVIQVLGSNEKLLGRVMY